MKRLTYGSADQTVNDIYLRREFPPPGKAKAASLGDAPTDRYNRALSALETALQSLDHTFAALTKVVGDDGQSLVEVRGVEPRLADAWRDLLRRVDEEMIVWARIFRRAYGAKTALPAEEQEDDDEVNEADPYADNRDEAADDWPIAGPQA